MVLEIASTLVERLLNEAAASPDFEICGLLFGTAERIEAVETCRNVAADPTRSFEIDPTALFAALRGDRAGGQRLIGYWHSHPVGGVEPSPRDLESAVDDGKLWLIVAGGDVAAWRVKVSAIHTYDEKSVRQDDEYGWVARPTFSGKHRKCFNHVPLATGQVRHLIPRDKCDDDLVPLIAAAGYPKIAPILDDLMAWTADPNWPVAGPLISYLATLDEAMVGPVQKVLRGDDNDHIFVCLRGIVRELSNDAKSMLREDLLRLAWTPRDSGGGTSVDQEARAILATLADAGA